MTVADRGKPLVPDVGVVGLVPDAWGTIWMPRHHVLTRLARYFHVVWANPAQNWRHAWGWSGERRTPVGDTHGIPNFHVYEPPRMLSSFHRPQMLARLVRDLRLRGAIRRARLLGARHLILHVWRPQFDFALDLCPDAISCYHIDDEYTFATTEQPVSAREERLLGRVDRVIVHAPGLWEKKAALASHAEMVPNGVDYRAYATPAAEPADLAAIPHPRVGYVGVIKRFLDIQLLVALARRHPQWSFVFVGPVKAMGPDEEPFQELKALPNVYLLGTRLPKELPAYTQHMDVGIMPYDVDGYTKFIYPLKLHEYLAAGLPVVGSPIRTLQDFASVIALADGTEAWSAALQAALESAGPETERIARGRAVANRHDWDEIAHRVATILSSALSEEVQEAVAAASPPPTATPGTEVHPLA